MDTSVYTHGRKLTLTIIAGDYPEHLFSLVSDTSTLILGRLESGFCNTVYRLCCSFTGLEAMEN